MPFENFKQIVNSAVNEFQKNKAIFHLRKNKLTKSIFDVYLESIPPEMNPVFISKRVYDCNCCRDVMNVFGTMFVVEGINIITIWDKVLEAINKSDDKTLEKWVPVVVELGESIRESLKATSVLANDVFNTNINLFDLVAFFSTDERRHGKPDLLYSFIPETKLTPISSEATAVPGATYNFSHFSADFDNKWLRRTMIGKSTYGNYVGELKDRIKKLFGEVPNVRCLSPDSLDYIDSATCERILELIDRTESPLYRGVEHRDRVTAYLSARNEIVAKLLAVSEEADYEFTEYWRIIQLNRASLMLEHRIVNTFYNSLIGRLANDIREAKDKAAANEDSYENLERAAIKAYTESMERKGVTTKVITGDHVSQIVTALDDEGYLESVTMRSHVSPSDVPVEAVVWSAAETVSLSYAETIKAKAKAVLPVKERTVHGDEISIEDFIRSVVPTASKMNLVTTGLKESQLCSLTGPGSATNPKNIFSHNNHFSLGFIGGTADYVTENVDKKGGDINVPFRVSLGWGKDGINLATDYDLWCTIFGPRKVDLKSNSYINKSKIYYADRILSDPSFDILDIDANSRGNKDEGVPVENMRFRESELKELTSKTLEFTVHAFTKSTTLPDAFDVVVDIKGTRRMFRCQNGLPHRDLVNVCSVDIDSDGNVDNLKILNADTIKEIPMDAGLTNGLWGLPVETKTPVSMILKSPTHWDNEEGKGNLIWMFVLPACKATTEITSLFNEQLSPKLHSYRRGIQVLAETNKVPVADAQVSGIGFSSTRREVAAVEVTDAANVKRTYKVRF